jgi:hypothetical protein
MTCGNLLIYNCCYLVSRDEHGYFAVTMPERLAVDIVESGGMTYLQIR